MMSALLSGVAAAAITAQLVSVPLTWSDLYTHTFNNNFSPTVGRTYMMRYTGARPAPFTKVRLTLSCVASSNYTLTKVYIGEIASDRSGYFFQSAPTQILFDEGNPSVTLTGSSSKLSDEIDFDFSGAHELGIAFYLSARTNGVQRQINGSFAFCYDMAGDTLPDPANTFTISSTTNVMIVSEIDVVLNQALVGNSIRASKQSMLVVKEGSNPSQPDSIRTTNQTIYVVKS